MKLFLLATSLFICMSSAQAQDYRLLDYDLVAPVVPSTAGIPNQTGLIFYQLGVGFRGVNASGGFDTFSPAGNAVTSAGSTEKIQRAVITQFGSTGCAITSQSGSWISSIVCSSTGNVTLNISGFTNSPTCVLTAVDGGASGYLFKLSTVSSTAISYITMNSGSALVNAVTHMICMGN